MSSFALGQTQVFFIFIFCGILIGLLFDFFRILRKSFKTPDIITYIEDVLFWLFTCIILALAIFKFNNGELRLFIFIGLFIGIFLYLLLISKYIIKVCVNMLCFIKKAIKTLVNFLIYPCNFLLNIIKKLIFRPISFIIINIRKNLPKLQKKL